MPSPSLPLPRPRSIDRISREEEKIQRAIIVIYVFITDRYFDATRFRALFSIAGRAIFASTPQFVSNLECFSTVRIIAAMVSRTARLVFGHSRNSHCDAIQLPPVIFLV